MIRGRRAPLISPLWVDHPAGAASPGAGTPHDFASASSAKTLDDSALGDTICPTGLQHLAELVAQRR